MLPKNNQIWPEIGIFVHFAPGLAGSFGALLVGWLVVVLCRLYLARHLFTLSLLSSPSQFWAARDISCDVTIDQDGWGSRVVCRDIRSSFIFLRSSCRDLAPSFSFKHQSTIKLHLGRKPQKGIWWCWEAISNKLMPFSFNLHLAYGKNTRKALLILLWTIWVVCNLRHPNEKFLVFGHLWCLSICRDDKPVSTVRPWTLSPK